MEHRVSFIRDPSYDHVRVGHLSVRRKSKANPTRGIHANGEGNCLCFIVERPVEFVQTSVFLSV